MHPLHRLYVKDEHSYLGVIHWLPKIIVLATVMLELTIIGEEGRM